MILRLKLTLKTLALGTLALISVVVAAALLIAYSGIYSVAATAGHPLWLDWFLALGMRRSVQVNSNKVVEPDLAQEALHIPLGASHFHAGCAVCHGYPGAAINPVFAHMLPTPPSLQFKVERWSREELFWIVKHGLQYAGMPAWSGAGRDDEVWSMVVFLKKLPTLSHEGYLQAVAGNTRQLDLPNRDTLTNSAKWVARHHCDSCHDNENAPPTTKLIPRLAGQKQPYLMRSLLEYQTNLRSSGYMEPAVAQIDTDVLQGLANHYTQITSPAWRNANNAESDKGKQLAEHGNPEKEIPACLSCHKQSSRGDYPLLDGQSAQYLKAQLEVFRSGVRDRTPYGRLMTHVAVALSDTEIKAVAEFFAARAPRGGRSE